MAFSTRSSDEKRFSVIVPLFRLRIFACTKPRRLPGVRCVTLKTEYRSLLYLITMPGRICVAEIIKILECRLDPTELLSIARPGQRPSRSNGNRARERAPAARGQATATLQELLRTAGSLREWGRNRSASVAYN